MSKTTKTAKKSTATKTAPRASTRTLDPRLPKIGVANTRTYHDVDYTWRVINDTGAIRLMGGKLAKGGEEFISVSSAAKRLTESETNGYAFFGLLVGGKPKAAKKAKPAKATKAGKKAIKAVKSKKASRPKSKANSAAAPTVATEATATAE